MFLCFSGNLGIYGLGVGPIGGGPIPIIYICVGYICAVRAVRVLSAYCMALRAVDLLVRVAGELGQADVLGV